MNYIKLYVFFLLITYSEQISFIRDDELQGLVFQSHRFVLHQTSEFQINYMFNVKFMDWIRGNLSEICSENENRLKYIEDTLKSIDTDWKEQSNMTVPSKAIEVVTLRMSRLQFNLRQLPHIVCGNLVNISNDFFELHREFVKLKSLDITSVFRMIDGHSLRNAVFKVIQNSTSFRHALSFDQWFIKWAIKQMTMEFHYTQGTIYFIFKFPLFDKELSDLYRVYAKPIIVNGNVFLYNNKMEYAIVNKKYALGFTETEFRENCFFSTRNFFCKNFTRKKNTCDYNSLTRLFENKSIEFDETCFDRLKNHNMITQINSQIYFLLFTPLDIEVKVGQTHFTTRIYESSKIIEVIDYEFHTPFFNFSPKNEYKYQIYISPIDESYALKFKFYSRSILDVYKILIYFTLIYIIIIFYRIFIYLRLKRNDENSRQINLPTIITTEL